MKANKKDNQSAEGYSRGEHMFAAGVVSLIFMGVGVYAYVFKSFRDGALYAVLTDAQALGVLIFCSLMSVVILLFTWIKSK